MEHQVKQEFNPNYSQPVTDAPRNRHDSRHADYKSPLMAGLLSIMPGLGQVYVGYYKHGFMYMFVYAFVIMLMSGMNLDESGLGPLGGLFLAFFFFFNIIDAVRRAKLFNRMIDGVATMEMPPDFELPGIRGSIATGIVLVAAGFLLFLHTMFDMSLVWLQDWWPLAVIGFGAWLIYKEMISRRNPDNSMDRTEPGQSAPPDSSKMYSE